MSVAPPLIGAYLVVGAILAATFAADKQPQGVRLVASTTLLLFLWPLGLLVAIGAFALALVRKASA